MNLLSKRKIGSEKSVMSFLVAFLLVMTLVIQVLGQEIKRQISVPPPVHLDGYATRIPTPQIAPEWESTWLRFAFDWTHCQVHRGNDATPIEIILTGTVASNCAEIWNLFTVPPERSGAPVLFFVNDIFEQSGRSNASNIPLAWEISFDNNPFTPVTIQPNNTLSINIPPGQHIFQLRMTASPQSGQVAGYYNLQMGQWILPQL